VLGLAEAPDLVDLPFVSDVSARMSARLSMGGGGGGPGGAGPEEEEDDTMRDASNVADLRELFHVTPVV
jgi:hypothetical protein